MKTIRGVILSLCMLLLMPMAHADSGLDFNFKIQGDHFRLEIKQEFKLPLDQLRRQYTPDFLPKISNIVKSVEINPIEEFISKIKVNSKKYGVSISTVGICTATDTMNESMNVCSLDTSSGDTSKFFNSGTENIHCTSTSTVTTCNFVMEASVKPLRYFIFYRSAEALALGGIMERIHDQAVLGRVVNLHETPETAKAKFEETNIGSCLDQIYNNYHKAAQKLEFTNTALEVKSSLWRCNP